MRYNHIIWDWNGTLFDDVQISIDAVNKMLENTQNSNRLNLESYRECFCFPVIEYYKKAGLDLETYSFDYLAQMYIDIFTKIQFTATLNDYTKTALEQFKNSNIEQSVISVCEQERLVNQIKKFGLEKYFDQVLGTSDNYAVGKQQIAGDFIKSNSINPENVVLIGDTYHDFEVAKSINCDCILVAGGHQSRRILEKSKTTVLDNLEQVCDFIL